MKTYSLNGEWKLCGKEQEKADGFIELTATVPGEVQLDLSAAGLLPEDLFFGKNICTTEKYEGYEWWYEKEFTAPAEKENIFLVFEGVDCIAEYFLNGEPIGSSNNAFIRHEFDITDKIKEGSNVLKVHLASAMAEAHYTPTDMASVLYSSHIGFNATAINLRKPPHSFGWDIMPRAVTAGLWRDVYIEVRDVLRFEQIYFNTTTEGFTFCYELGGKYSDLYDTQIELKGSCKDSSFNVRIPVKWKIGRTFIKPDNPVLWWPYGYGEPSLYETEVTILRGGVPVHTCKHNIGLRTVELDRTDFTDGVNGKFRFMVNGEEIMCKGSNWVPLDAFHSRDKLRYEKAFELVKDIGCNILRCWGGNVYEDTEFYDFCDKNGVMIWQDFAMACNSYPEDPAFLENIRKEAEAVIRKFRNHPSLILWSGDNEIDGFHCNNGRDPDTNIITREIIPRTVLRNDKDRPYLASSPYTTTEFFHDRSKKPSEAHLWGARDFYKADMYKNSTAHFVSETGYHGCPSLSSVKKFISPEKVWPYRNNDEWALHSSDQNFRDHRVILMERQVRQLFGAVPENPEDYILASQISQAEAKKFFIERIRAARPIKSGIIWWNLLDGWPQMSDAVVDYYFEKKLAYDYIKRSQAPFTVICGEIRNWNLPVFVCNDTLVEKHGTVKVTDGESGEVMYEGVFDIGRNQVGKITEFPVYYSEQRLFIITWETGEEKGFNHYVAGNVPFDLERYKKWLSLINKM